MADRPPALDCLDRGHIYTALLGEDGEEIARWCLWCGCAVVDVKHPVYRSWAEREVCGGDSD